MEYSSWCTVSPIISGFVCFFFLGFSFCPAYSLEQGILDHQNQILRPGNSTEFIGIINDHLMKINKPAIKTIQSPDGDLIDCVLTHQQPAFDHPKLKGQKPLDPPEKTKGQNPSDVLLEKYQMWSMAGESCPEGTVPIRRTKKQDIFRASSLQRFGRKTTRRDSTSNGHEHAVGYVSGDQYNGAKASINVWSPTVAGANEFSISQMWVTAGSFGDDLNTVEAGWQVSPQLYGNYYPRLFTYWTRDAYRDTGCYNLLCSGFVQTSSRIAIGAAISPISSYNGSQFDITLLIRKDPKDGNWWLEYGSGEQVGYWPSVLFTHLKNSSSMVQFGGEIVNSGTSGSHTSTQMGSGHFAGEGYGKASYFRNLQVVDLNNNLVPLSNLQITADNPNCYDIQGRTNQDWGSYFYYGGPGRNSKCP